MNAGPRKLLNINGQDSLLNGEDIEFTKDRCLTVTDINLKSADDFCSCVRVLAKESKEPITVRIISPGGDVQAGLYMYDTLVSCGCEIITCACGLAASMGAFLLATAGTKGMRYCQPNAKVLIHQPLGGVQGQASDMKIHVEDILNTKNKLNRMLSKATGQSIKKIETDTERDNIMSAEAALEYGLVDHIGDPEFNTEVC